MSTKCSNFTALPSNYRRQCSSSGKIYTVHSSASLWESDRNNPITGTVKQLRAGLDGHRSAPSDHTGQPPPNVSSGDLIASPSIVSTGTCPIQEISNYVSVLPTQHFISSDIFISCFQHVNSSYLGIASFIKKEQLNSPFRRRGRRKYRWNFVCPPNQNYTCSSNAYDFSHVQISQFTIGGKPYCWDSYLAPSDCGRMPSAYMSN